MAWVSLVAQTYRIPQYERFRAGLTDQLRFAIAYSMVLLDDKCQATQVVSVERF